MSFCKKTKKWIGFDFDGYKTFENPPREGTDESDEMRQFFRDFRSDLKAMLKNTGLKIYQMKKNYYDVTLIISDEAETKFCLLSCGDVRWSDWSRRMYIRGMETPNDWSGRNFNNVNTNVERLKEDLTDMFERRLKAV